MGHYNSEMESESEYRRRMDPVNRTLKICKELESVPLSIFKASDLVALADVQGIKDNHGFGPNSDHLELIEERVREWKKKSKKARK